jgi:hypothetical protein
MADWPLGGLEWRFLQDGCVERTPTGILAMGDQAVAGTKHAAMRFARGEDGIGWYDHGIIPNLGRTAIIVHYGLKTIMKRRPAQLRLAF